MSITFDGFAESVRIDPYTKARFSVEIEFAEYDFDDLIDAILEKVNLSDIIEHIGEKKILNNMDKDTIRTHLISEGETL